MAEYLPQIAHFITVNAEDGTSTFHNSPNPPSSNAIGPSRSVTYIYSTPPSTSGPSIANNTDFEHHLSVATNPSLASFPAAGGSMCAILDFGPNPTGQTSHIHRTNTLDYVFIMEGELELTLDSGETRVLKKGDVVVQRAAWHAWRNLSKTESARMASVLLGAAGAVEGAIEFPKAKE